MEGWGLDPLAGSGCDNLVWQLLDGEVSPLGSWRIEALLIAIVVATCHNAHVFILLVLCTLDR